MSIRIIKSGLQTSIQDLGRQGQMNNGIAQSGAMDPVAMQIANWLVGNPHFKPVIEATLIGPVLEFEKTMSIAVVGANFDLYLNGQLVFNDETITVNQHDILEFDKLNSGARAYLAFSGNLQLPFILNSYSTNLVANFGGKNLHDGDQIKLSETQTVPKKMLSENFSQRYSGNYLLRCIPSVETHWFDQKETTLFFAQSYQVTANSNRMGVRLNGLPLTTALKPQLISSGLTQGSIQIPNSGQPIISSVDGQTIGGYPRIANVISADLSTLGQLKANDKINFHMISPKEAIIILHKKKKSYSSFIDSFNQ